MGTKPEHYKEYLQDHYGQSTKIEQSTPYLHSTVYIFMLLPPLIPVAAYIEHQSHHGNSDNHQKPA